MSNYYEETGPRRKLSLKDKRKRIWKHGEKPNFDFIYDEEDVAQAVDDEWIAIDQLLNFLCADLWYAVHNEHKNEQDLIKYLQDHFNIMLKKRKEVFGDFSEEESK